MMSEDSHPDGPEPPAAGSDATGIEGRNSTDAPPPVRRVFVLLYALAYVGTILLFLAPLLVSLSLKVNALVGTDRAPNSLSLVAGTGAFLAMFANPFFGKMSDRTASRLGMRRPWMVIGLIGGSVGILVVALAASIPVVLVGWCIAQVFFNALLAALVAVLPDQVPVTQRGRVAGVLGICLPIASVSGTYVVQLFTGNTLAMFLAPCGIGGFLILLFAANLKDRRLAVAERPAWSLREFTSTFYLNPWKHRDFGWAFASRFMLVLAYAFLTTYQVYYLLKKLGSAASDVPRQLFLATLAMSSVVVVASLVGGWLSDRTGRRKVFVGSASVVFGLALFVIAYANTFSGFVVGMAIGGLGFGLYTAVDLALVADVLPDPGSAAKDLGVMNIAGALPSSVAPAVAPGILALSQGSYGALYAVAGGCAVLGAAAILRVKRVR
jgi:MFS family permease